MKKILFGIIIGLAISVPSTIFASGVISMIGKKIDGELNVTLNKSKLSDTAIVVEGTSYLPVRAIGDALGLDVTFDPINGIALDKRDNSPVITGIRKEIEVLNAQLMDLAQVLGPYIHYDSAPDGTSLHKEKDSIYNETIAKRENLVAQRDVLEKKLNELQKQ